MQKNILICICLGWLLLISCTTRNNTDLLYGKYSFDRNQNDSIYLKRDGSYEHKYYRSNGQIFESNGNWKYDSITNVIRFKSFIFFSENGAENIPPGNWHSKVQVTEDQVRLIYSDEENIGYSKRRVNSQ